MHTIRPNSSAVIKVQGSGIVFAKPIQSLINVWLKEGLEKGVKMGGPSEFPGVGTDALGARPGLGYGR